MEPCDAVVFLQTIEHVKEPQKVLSQFKAICETVYVSTPNLLTLAPPGAAKSDNPWHLREYRADEFRALCESVFERVELLGLFHARKLRAHELALRAGWDGVHAAAGHHQALLRPLHPRDLRARLRAAAGTARGRAGLRRGAALSPRRPGALALVLHSHMPYVEGFGTWPFGEEWLWEAVACVYLPLLDVLDGAPVTLGLTPVLCDQLEAMRGRARRALPALPARRPRAHPRRGRGRAGARGRAPAGRRGAQLGRRLRVRRAGLRAPWPRPAACLRRAAAGGALDLGRDPRAAAAARHRRRAPAPARDGHGVAPAPLRRLGRRLLAARVRLRRRCSSATSPTMA